jgi:hypothetical protein
MPRLGAEGLWADVARIYIELDDAHRSEFGISKNDAISFGSGRLIGRNLVLTARHVLETKSGARLPDKGWDVRLLGDRLRDGWPGAPIPAKVVWRGNSSIDLALLELEDGDHSPCNVIHLRLGRYDGTADLTNVWLAGFPRAAREQRDVAKEYGAPARLRRSDLGGLYQLAIDAANAPRVDDDWSGCSGAAVIFRRRDVVWILGAVQQVPRAFGLGALQVAPISAAMGDREFGRLIAEHCAFDHSDIEDLGRLPGRYEPIGTEAYAASHRTFSLLSNNPNIYGRARDLQALDDILKQDRGVVLLRAEAGLGKSTVSARWAIRQAANTDNAVLYHAFSVHEPMAGSRFNMVESLVRQAALLLGPDELGEGEPGDAARLTDRLAALLSRDQPEGMRLLVVIDALDEAAEPIEPWSVRIGRGVYVLATCRAEAGERPAALRRWHERATDSGVPAIEMVLPPSTRMRSPRG